MAKSNRFKLTKNPVSLLKLIPNMITIAGLCIGFSSIRFALDEKWELSALCIVVAAFIDGVDGKIARLLNATSTFGAELDSLSDFVNFGIAPVLITYLWIYHDYGIKLISWGIVLLFAVCACIRLARFNTMAFSPSEGKNLSNYFVGVPSPSGAILALLPLINEFDIKEFTNFSFRSHSAFIAIYQVFIGILMASRLPTFSLRNITIKPEYLWISMIVFGIFAISIFLYTWIIIPLISLVYLCSIPYSYHYFYKTKESEQSKK